MDATGVAEIFAKIDPEFRKKLEKISKSWAPENPPPTILLGELGVTLSELIQADKFEVAREALSLTEKLMVSASPSIRDIVATGLLEALLAQSSAGKVSLGTVVGYMGDETKKYCRAWDSFTGVKTAGLW